MRGKDKCKILKELRRKIAEENDIALDIAECTHKGECKGTCPRCEAEVRVLEQELEKRRGNRKRVALVGLAAGMAFAASSCDMIEDAYEDTLDSVRRLLGIKPVVDDMGMIDIDDQNIELLGDVPYEYNELTGLIEMAPEVEETTVCEKE